MIISAVISGIIFTGCSQTEEITTVTTTSETTQGSVSCDFLSGLWQLSESNGVTFELFKAKDDKNVESYYSYNELNIDLNDDRYDHQTKTFEDEGENELSKEFSEYMSSYTKNNSNKVFDWKDL